MVLKWTFIPGSAQEKREKRSCRERTGGFGKGKETPNTQEKISKTREPCRTSRDSHGTRGHVGVRRKRGVRIRIYTSDINTKPTEEKREIKKKVTSRDTNRDSVASPGSQESFAEIRQGQEKG